MSVRKYTEGEGGRGTEVEGERGRGRWRGVVKGLAWQLSPLTIA